MASPTSIALFTYRVGFGDCFLLRFGYPAGVKRHVLIDFGSTAAPPKIDGGQMKEIARHVAETCGHKLDAVVVTHRHADHLSGFAGETWPIIRDLKPELVLLPWTEDDKAAPDARAATRRSAPGQGLRATGPRAALSAMQAVAGSALEEVRAKGHKDVVAPVRRALVVPDADEEADEDQAWNAPRRPFGKALTKQLMFLGMENLANAAAVENLRTLPREFLAHGSKTRLEELLPGVQVTVLGPPTLEQSASIRSQRDVDADEFWHVAAGALAGAAPGSAPLFPGFRPVPASRQPLEVRWFMKRMDQLRGEELLELVRILDAAMNNTSLILLFEACGKKLLFPGDAQIENWSYALSQPGVKALLEGVDLYKVGHHGSLNATPKSLWKLFKKRGPARKLKAILSTRPGKHGSPQRGTEVPRGKLVTALQAETELVNTARMTKKEDYVVETRIA